MTEKSTTTVRKIFLPYFFDIVAPFLAYFVVHRFGARTILALTVGGLMAATSTAVNTIRRKGLDRVGMLVVLEIAASMVMFLVMRDARLMLIPPSFYTAGAAVPDLYSLCRPTAQLRRRAPHGDKGSPVRMAAYEKLWDQSAEFRQSHKMVTLAFGLAFMIDSILRIVIVYRLPIERSAWRSNVPHATTMFLVVALSAIGGQKIPSNWDECG